jgi:hypothetical protein
MIEVGNINNYLYSDADYLPLETALCFKGVAIPFLSLLRFDLVESLPILCNMLLAAYYSLLESPSLSVIILTFFIFLLSLL